MSKIKSLHDVLIEEIRDLYNAEVQLTKALPKVAKAIDDRQLKAAVEQHLQQTRGHVKRLEQVAKILGVSPKGKVCQAMKGLIHEGGERIQSGKPGSGRDAGLICAAQKVEHYEIAGYGSVHAFATLLGLSGVAELLQATLDEEAATDRKLTELSEKINRQAETPEGLKKAS